MWNLFRCFCSYPKTLDLNTQKLLEDECAICLICLSKEKCVKLKCGHIYHKQCFILYMNTNKKYNRQTYCPFCYDTQI
jgi:hypothetical protein